MHKKTCYISFATHEPVLEMHNYATARMQQQSKRTQMLFSLALHGAPHKLAHTQQALTVCARRGRFAALSMVLLSLSHARLLPNKSRSMPGRGPPV